MDKITIEVLKQDIEDMKTAKAQAYIAMLDAVAWFQSRTEKLMELEADLEISKQLEK